MKTIDKYLTEAKVQLKRNDIKKLLDKPKSGSYDIDGNKVKITVVEDTMIWRYSSDMHELTYMLIDLSDDMNYKYQQIGMNTKESMKFIVDLS